MTSTQKRKLKNKFQHRDEDDEGNEPHGSHTGMTSSPKRRLRKKFQPREEYDEGNEQHGSHTGMTSAPKRGLRKKFQHREEDDEGNDQYRSHTGMASTQKSRLNYKFQLRDEDDEDDEGNEQHGSHTDFVDPPSTKHRGFMEQIIKKPVGVGKASAQKRKLRKKFQSRDEDNEGNEQCPAQKRRLDEDNEGNEQYRSHTVTMEVEGKASAQKRKLRKKFQPRDEDNEGNEQYPAQKRRLDEDNEGNEQYRSHIVTMEGPGGNNVINVEGNIKVRGPTMMAKIWALPPGHPKIKIVSNALGQPIGRTKTTFVEFIGSVARNGDYAPIHLRSWRHMPLDKKKDMIAIVKEKFEVPLGMDYWIMKAIGRRWKNWKAYLKARYYNENIPMESEVIKDSRVIKGQWEQIIVYWRTDEAKRMSKRNKRTRQKKVMHHRTGKRSFAQVHDVLKDDEKEVGPPTRVRLFKACYLDGNQNANSSAVANVVAAMDQMTSQLPDSFHDKVAPDDVFAQVIGKDRNGRVRMMGGGIAPSDLWDSFPSRGGSYRMAMEEYKSALDQQTEINKRLTAELAEIRAMVKQHMRKVHMSSIWCL